MAFKLLRFYESDDKATETIGVVRTKEEAWEHCNDPETNSSTATSTEAQVRTRLYGPWFDGFTEIKD